MNNKKIKKILSYSFYIISIMVLALFFVMKKCQNDLFFDIKTGESILKYGIDFKDHFSFIPNLTYLYHHYLYDIGIYFLFKAFSYPGIFVFFLTLFTLFGIIIFLINNSNSHNKLLSFILTVITLLIMSGYFTNRVQSITYILFLLEVYFLNKLYDTGEKKYSVFIILISVIIANIHMPMWILTIVFALPFLAEYLIYKVKIFNEIISSRIIIKKCANEKVFLITLGLLLLSGFISPLKFYPYTFFLKAIGNNDFQFISEMTYTVFIKHIYTLFLFFLAILILVVFKTKYKLRDLLYLLGLFLLSTLANRNIAYVYLFYPIILFKIIAENIDFKKLKIDVNISAKVKDILMSLTIISLVGIYILVFIKLDIKHFDYNINKDYPDATVKYIKENLDYKNIKLFNEFNFGSYLEFNDIPVFIDSRAEVYIQNFNGGKDIVNDFLGTEEYQKYKSIFRKYDFDYALIYQNKNLYTYLIKDDDYEEIYHEDLFVLFKCLK